MIATFIVRIIFYGLVAYAPITNKDSKLATAIKVLMPDVRGGVAASDGCLIPEHTPAVFVEADSCTVGGKSCTPDRDLEIHFGGVPCDPAPGTGLISNVIGAFQLRDRELTIAVPGPPRPLPVARQPGSASLPAGPGDVGKSSWLPMAKMGIQVDPRCLNGKAECPLAARTVLTGGATLTTCHLAAIGKSPNDQVCAFALAPLSASAPPGSDAQAVADAVMVTFELPRKQQVKLHLGGLKRDDPKNVGQDIVLTPGERPFVNVWVVNMPMHGNDPTDKCIDEKLDKHFETFYNLARKSALGKPIALGERPIPQATKACVAAAKVEPDPTTATGCPILHFEPRPKAGAAPSCKPGAGFIIGDRPACGNFQFLPAQQP